MAERMCWAATIPDHTRPYQTIPDHTRPYQLADATGMATGM